MITTERLMIRRVETGDWRDIQEIWKDFSASPYAGYDRRNDTEDEAVAERIGRWTMFSRSLDHQFYAVVLEGRVIGYVAVNYHLHPFREDTDECRYGDYEIGYCFHSDYHGKGYARESISAVLGELKNQGVKRITAGTALKNEPSVRLLEALGFRQTRMERISFHTDDRGDKIWFEGGWYEYAAGLEAEE